MNDKTCMQGLFSESTNSCLMKGYVDLQLSHTDKLSYAYNHKLVCRLYLHGLYVGIVHAPVREFKA